VIQLNDLVCANVEENGKKVAKTSAFKKTYFNFGPTDPIEDRDKQFNGSPIGKVSVPKESESKHSVTELYDEMIKFFATKYATTKDGVVTPANAHKVVLDLVTSAFDIAERAPIAVALRPAKPLDETKVFESTAKNFAAMGGIVDPTSGEKVTDIPSIIAVLRAMSGK
jgi:hypothetical protein